MGFRLWTLGGFATEGVYQCIEDSSSFRRLALDALQFSGISESICDGQLIFNLFRRTVCHIEETLIVGFAGPRELAMNGRRSTVPQWKFEG